MDRWSTDLCAAPFRPDRSGTRRVDELQFEHEHDRISHAFGAIGRLIASTGYRSLKLGSVEAQLVPPIRLRQVRMMFGPKRIPLAFASWAFVSASVSDELRANPNRLLHLSEWNEGTILWIMDFVAIRGRAGDLARSLRDQLAVDHDEARWSRHGRSIMMRVST